MPKKRTLTALLIIAVAILSVVFNQKPYNSNLAKSISPTPISNATVSAQIATVARVVDGDTIVIDSGQKVRYIGMDTPETHDPRKPVQCFGPEAAEKNKQLVEGKIVRLVKDVSETDKYGRLLRYVYLDKPATTEAIFVNEYLVKAGYARVLTIPPDVKYADQFLKDQQQAQQHNMGLWSKCE